MEIRGWVYLIANKAMPGLLKIGYSTKDPILRAKELGNTGSPHPYDLLFDMLVISPYEIEQKIHNELADFNENKEWFRCTPQEAIKIMRAVASNSIILENYRIANHTPVNESEKCGSGRVESIEARRVFENLLKELRESEFFYLLDLWIRLLKSCHLQILGLKGDKIELDRLTHLNFSDIYENIDYSIISILEEIADAYTEAFSLNQPIESNLDLENPLSSDIELFDHREIESYEDVILYTFSRILLNNYWR